MEKFIFAAIVNLSVNKNEFVKYLTENPLTRRTAISRNKEQNK